jgi:glycosyltransferase involved in cell wall biosynthesis
VRILFIHEINWWEKVIYEIHELPELLSISGHEVTLIDFPENYTPKGLGRFLDLKSKIIKSAKRAYDSGAIEVRTPGRVVTPPFDRIFASITFLPLLIRTVKQKRPEAIVLYGVPTNGWQTVIIAKILGIPVLFRAIDVSHELRKSSLSALILKAEKFIYRNVDAISANNKALANYCVSQGANPERVSVEYPGMDIELLKPTNRDLTLSTELGIGDQDKVIVFMGTLYRFAGLDQFLTLIAPRLNDLPDTKILFIGGGEAEQDLHKLVKTLEIQNKVIFTGFVDYSELPKYLSLGDVAINTFPSTLVTNCALPSKVLQYLCCGIPTIATPVEGLCGLVADGEGVIYRELNQDFVTAIIEVLHDEGYNSMKIRARESAVEKVSWAVNILKFEELLMKLALSSK